MPFTPGVRRRYVFISVLVALALLRLCFAGVLWADEDYHMAAAIDVLHGMTPYRDFWYDKPPLAALYYLLMGALPGLWLRVWDATYVLLCCFLGYKLARDWWGELEGRWAAFLIAFFTTFYLPAAVIPFAPDALLIAPHLAAVYFARRGKPLVAGLVCGAGFWINVKALFVLAACLVWGWTAVLGFGAVVVVGVGGLAASGGLRDYWYQVWAWGLSYAAGSAVAHPLLLAMERIGRWVGFHLALVVAWVNGVRGAAGERWKIVAWLAFSFAAVCFGNHFAPRYFLQLLPPLAVVGARGIVLALPRWRWAAAVLALLLLVPLVQFGPRYVLMARHAAWGDIALDMDSQAVAAKINAVKRPGDTLFVWGYRPDVYVFTRMSPAGPIWDSQPLTGVAADRHLTAQEPVVSKQTERNWYDVRQPEFLVDGLGPLNNNLRPERFPENARLAERLSRDWANEAQCDLSQDRLGYFLIMRLKAGFCKLPSTSRRSSPLKK